MGVEGLGYCLAFLCGASCAAQWEMLGWDQFQSVDWSEWHLQEMWQMLDRVWLCQLGSWCKAWWGHLSTEGWHELLQWLDEECEVCHLKLLLLSWCKWWWDCDLLKCLHVWDHNRWSVICPFGCGYIYALNEICLGGVWSVPLGVGYINALNGICLEEGILLGQFCAKWPNSSQA